MLKFKSGHAFAFLLFVETRDFSNRKSIQNYQFSICDQIKKKAVLNPGIETFSSIFLR